jgi:hypothetical protein
VPLALTMLAAFLYNSFAFHITMAQSSLAAPLVVSGNTRHTCAVFQDYGIQSTAAPCIRNGRFANQSPCLTPQADQQASHH